MKYIFIILFILCFFNVNAQNWHLTQNAMAPTVSNPAFTGLFGGDVRVNAIYRSQWKSVSSRGAAKTIIAGVDGKVAKGFGKNDWLSAGLSFMNDKAGTVSLSTNSISASVAYSHNLGNDLQNFVSAGFQLGINQQKFDLSQAQFGNQFTGVFVDEALGSGEMIDFNPKWYMGIGAGLSYYWIKNMRTYAYGGGAAFNIGSPKIDRGSTIDEKIPMRITVHAGASIKVSSKWDVVPSFYLFQQSESIKADMIAAARYVFYENKRTQVLNAFQVGMGLRMNKNNATVTGVSKMDAFIIQAKIEVEKVTAALAYDVNISDLQTASNTNGAVELALSYNIGIRQNNYQRGGSVNCPRF